MATNLLDKEDRELTENFLKGAAILDQNIALFEFGSVVVQKDYFENENVRVISGGTYSLEDLVGKGMLTSYIQGEQQVAPLSSLILRTVRELSYNHFKGSLLIVPADQGNTLNFGLAAERAWNDELMIKMISVAEDFYNYTKTNAEKRGLSGVVLATKIAGAMSERGKSLMEIYTCCTNVIENMSSMGIHVPTSLDNRTTRCTCTKIIQEIFESDSKKKKKRAKVQYSFDYEIYMQVLRMVNVKTSPEDIDIPGKLNLLPDDSIIVLVNSCQALLKVEQLICARGLLKAINSIDINVSRFYIGEFLSESADINLTITILKLFDKSILEYLDDPCSAPGWRMVNQYKTLTESAKLPGKLRRKERLAPPIRGPILNERQANVLLFCTQFACDALISCEKQLNLIDSEKGDANAGTRLKGAAEVLLKRMKLDKVITNCPFTFFESLSKILERTVGGITGCVYSILLESVAGVFGKLKNDDMITPYTWLLALETATGALQRYGNATFGEGTMLDPILACTEVVKDSLEAQTDYIEAFEKGVAKAEEVAQLTKRGNRVYPDAGAHAMGIWLRAAFEGFRCVNPT